MRRPLVVIPLLIFAALVVLLAIGLTRDPSQVPSPLIGKPAPEFSVPSLFEDQPPVSSADLRGQVALVNIWASWCVGCREEHGYLVNLAAQGVPIVGLNYKDGREAGQGWLRQFRNPYRLVAFDPDGRVGLDWGVYGVPETFVLDRHGVIRHKHIGPLTEKAAADLLTLIQQLRQEEG